MGGSRPTMADVAREAGISTALVSIVMRGAPGASDATRSRVKRIAEDMGYVPDERARKLRRTRSRLLGVAFQLQQPFHADLVEEIYEATADTGYEIALSAVTPRRDRETAAQALLRERCDAIVLLGGGMDAPAAARLAERVPTLVVAGRCDAPGVGVVRADDGAGVSLAVDHLAGLGHRRIAHIDGGRAAGAEDRREGFRAAVERHGLAGSAEVVGGGLTEADGARGAQRLLARPHPPTAVVAFNDRCALGVLEALAREGVEVPGRMSVVGYDDSRFARSAFTRTTTVSQDAGRMARAVVSGALARIAGGAPEEVVLPVHLVPGETTGPAPR
ncbi:LacI family DNA-binding transcriptional regulator [Nocardiopsis composta]|uniref:LacI family transcriptional regulator n=1 Tax=Nocardiopsis composta TaxID=157465 RepID=A0A7W8QI48_9ACTN|nr:LacI family DNA-binding transcriptional regulator [Nocardiopsis composta]MBB5430937.1 LacI family transcriptional regulator [Nocardiopsis composta]